MKTLTCIKAAVAVLLLSAISSCSTTKKMALSCPELTSNHKGRTSLNHPRNNKKHYTVTKKDSKRSYSYSKHTSKSSKNKTKPVNTLDRLNMQQSNPAPTQSENISAARKTEYKTGLYAEIDNSAVPVEEIYSPASMHKDEVADFETDDKVYNGVDLIPTEPFDNGLSYLKHSGTELSTISQAYIKNEAQDTLYLKNGSNVVGKLLQQSKAEYRFQASNGMIFIFTPDKVEKVVLTDESSTNVQTQEGTEKKMEPHAKVGFITALAGVIGNIIFIPILAYDYGDTAGNVAAVGIVLSDISLLVGLVATLISIKKFKENPGKYKGKGLAKAQLIIWAVVVVTALILILLAL